MESLDLSEGPIQFSEEQMTARGNEDKHLHNQLVSVIGAIRSTLSDIRRTPEDAIGHLADHQIRQCHLDEFRKEAELNWPDIRAIEFGVHRDTCPYIAIRISPFTEKSAEHHNELFELMKRRFPQTLGLAFHCLPLGEASAINTSTLLFKRAA